MSICNVDKWNMLAPTFDAFEIPKIEEDDCLTLINNLKLITKDSSVLDVGCGAGRYAIAFAQVCHNVIGTDLSPQMIEYAKKRAGNMGISHVSFVCEDWDTISIQERNYQNQFDFVFAHMTPAIHNTETLMKMQACSKKWCMLVRHIHMETPLMVAAKQKLNLSNINSLNSYGADQIFHDLWEQGKRPQIAYFNQKRNMQRPIDVELSLLFEDIEKLTPLTPEVKEELTHLASDYTKDGIVHQTYEVPIFAMYWNVL